MKLRNFLTSAATVEFYREGRRTPGYRLFDFLHGYVYGRWLYLYLGIGTGEHRLAKVVAPLGKALARLRPARNDHHNVEPGSTRRPATFADSYHGKVVPLEAAQQLVVINEPVQISLPEQVIPYPKARDIIMKNPEHVVALQCPCRSARLNPCLPLDVCLVVGDPFASFVEQHHPQRSRRISQTEALEILRAEDARGHVHHAFFKDAMLGRFYAICNCCACCYGAMHAHQHGTPMLASSGYVCVVDEALCLACGDCQEFCQFEAMSLGLYASQVDYEKCMGCGVCVSKCLQGALSLDRAPEKGEPLEIQKLMEMYTFSLPQTLQDQVL